MALAVLQNVQPVIVLELSTGIPVSVDFLNIGLKELFIPLLYIPPFALVVINRVM